MANAKVTGNTLLSYDLIQEDGKWSREVGQNINLSTGGRAGLASLFGLNLGIARRGKDLSLLGGLTPTYALNLQGRHYNLSSGYSAHFFRDLISPRAYGNLSIFLPSLPTFRVTYAQQGTRDIQEEHRINSTGSNIELEAEDEIGPFRIRVNKRENSLRDLVRGPESDVTSSETSGDIDFGYSYGRLFSVDGRYGRGQRRTERAMTGEVKGKTRDFSLDFQMSPISTITLSASTVGRQEQQAEGSRNGVEDSRNGEGLQREFSSNLLTNRLQLMLEPVDGILLNATYSQNDTSFGDGTLYSDESKSLMINLEPRRNVVFSGQFVSFDSQENDMRSSALKRNTFDLRAEPIEGLRMTSRLDLSTSEDFVTGFFSDRNGVTTILEATPTEDIRTEISYDWQAFSRSSEDIVEEEVQQRVVFAIDYSFVRILNLNLRVSKDISSEREGGTTSLSYGLNYLTADSYVNIRYSRFSSLEGISSLQQENRSTTRAFRVELGQGVGRDTDVRLSYESQFSDRALARGIRRISVSVSARF